MPLICAMLWWEILDTAEITWKKQRDELSHKTLNYIFPALKKKKKKVYCSQFNCKINSLNVPFHADGRFIKHSELVGIRHNKQNHDKMTKNRTQQM